jgi:hypothetical protein
VWYNLNPTLSITVEETALLWGGIYYVEEASDFFLSTIANDPLFNPFGVFAEVSALIFVNFLE